VKASADAPETAARLADGIVGAIGDTPLVRMRRLLQPAAVELWAKLESANPGGSAKDRPAARMIAEALRTGAIGPSTTVIESSSGNMAIGLAQACRFHGLSLICVLDSKTDGTTVRTLRAFGADVRIVNQPDPVSGDLLTARLNLVARLAEQIPNSFWPDQYSNWANPAAHAEGTAREIDEALGGELDYLVVAAGTAGTVRGCAQYLREHERETKLIAVDACGSALFGGQAGPRKLRGHGAGIESRHSRGVAYDRLVRVSDLDCVIGCRRLLDREAIFAGASSGAVATALERVLPWIEAGSTCAIILPDGGAGYLDTVYDDDWVNAELGCTPSELEWATRAERHVAPSHG
jgi:cysteine synthase A